MPRPDPPAPATPTTPTTATTPTSQTSPPGPVARPVSAHRRRAARRLLLAAARRRTLVLATSVGLTAPLLGLPTLSTDLTTGRVPAAPTTWDELGSLTAAALAVRGLDALPDPDEAVLDDRDAVGTADAVDAVDAQLDRDVTSYAEALGLDAAPGVATTRAVAAELGIDLPDVPDPGAAEALHNAWLESLRPAFEQLGIDPRRRVDARDLVALGRALGTDVGTGADAASARAIAPALAELAERPPVVGHVGGVPLSLPSHDVLLAGWHEAAGPSALPMTPLDGRGTQQLPSRGRPTHPQSALDVAVTPGTPALAPVTGTVVETTPYLLYGRHPDTRIVVRPDDAPHLEVAVLHVTGPLVTVGDHVTSGTPIASEATALPFPSQIERITGTTPHIHIEVKRP